MTAFGSSKIISSSVEDEISKQV